MADYDAKQFEPVLIPHFGVAVFTPTSSCPHKGRYRRGSSLVCMSCHRSGKDHLPVFKHVSEPALPAPPDPEETDPWIKVRAEIIWERFMAHAYRPESEPIQDEPTEAPELPKETRKERRRRLYGSIVQAMTTAPSPAA